MNARWYPEELAQFFTLLEQERSLLASKTQQSRLGFAVLLKFFQYKGRFPLTPDEIPQEAIVYLAEQLGVSPEEYACYDWSGRMIKYHRAEIRELVGFREITTEDTEQLAQWLVATLEQHDPEQLEPLASAHLCELRIEPPVPEHFQRMIRSAIHTHEQRLYQKIVSRLSDETRQRLDTLLETTQRQESRHHDTAGWESSPLAELRQDAGPPGLDSVLAEVAKLRQIRDLQLSTLLFDDLTPRTLRTFRHRAAVEPPRELRRHPDEVRYALLAAYCFLRGREITDNLVELLLQVVHRMEVRAEKKVNQEMLLAALERVQGKDKILFRVAQTALEEPDGTIRKVLFPVVGEETLQALVKESKAKGPVYRFSLQAKMKLSYGSRYRRMLPEILSVLEFRSNNEMHQPVIKAIELLKRYTGSHLQFFPSGENVPIDGVVPPTWHQHVYKNKGSKSRIHRVSYELCVLEALRERLRTKEIWVVGADHWRNPDEDLPPDFSQKREFYYEALHQPLDVEFFISCLQEAMAAALAKLEQNLPKNPDVSLRQTGKKRIKLSPIKAQPEPKNIARLKEDLMFHWPMISLLDILKETDLRVSFTEHLHSTGTREMLAPQTLRKRLLLCLYALGTNIGLKRVTAGDHGENYKNLLYVQRRFIGKDQLRAAISHLVNEILAIRNPHLWGETTTSCASDSKQFGAWDQNLMTEWHNRYGGRGIMIYWHVERKAACIYSQLKRCSSSEVASMIEGVLRHCTEMEIERQYVDSHGQSQVAFAFCHLLGFRLLPRLKRIASQKLYLPRDNEEERYPNLQPILTRPINWILIRQQYDEMIKYTTALRFGTADAEAILRRFTKDNKKHPTYLALLELGNAAKTIFLCNYLDSLELRYETQEALNVIELWNGLNDLILIGKKGEMATNQRDAQELTMLALHLLQNSLIYINTLMFQQLLSTPQWQNRLTPDDLRALTPLQFAHINPYGTFHLDLNERLPLELSFPSTFPQEKPLGFK